MMSLGGSKTDSHNWALEVMNVGGGGWLRIDAA